MLDRHEHKRLIRLFQDDWGLFAKHAFKVVLDPEQEAILESCRVNPRTVVKSGHARGKDFVAAVAGLCFFYTRYPAKVITTAPTGRQVKSIMLAEMKRIWNQSPYALGGRFLDWGLKMDDNPDWFILGFKAGDKDTEAWTGFHSPHLMVTVTEASGLPDETFYALEGLLTGNSRLLMVMNPNRTSGEAYNAFRSPLYAKFTLSCLDAPNVKARRTLIPGQVDWQWINALMQKPGWVTEVPRGEAHPDDGDFEWDMDDGRGPRWYRPGDLFRVKVLGMWASESESQLIPLAWIEAAQHRWQEWQDVGGQLDEPLRLGVDVAGMGSDMTVFCARHGQVVRDMTAYPRADHMATVGRVLERLKADGDAAAFIDTIGEGAGIHSRLVEQGANSVSVKFSEGARGLTDLTGERRFRNMRAYCYWAIRDALNPELGGSLALPPFDDLTQDLTAQTWRITSTGEIILDDKETVIKPRLGRSPDWSDALANTFYPHSGFEVVEGAFGGVGVF